MNAFAGLLQGEDVAIHLFNSLLNSFLYFGLSFSYVKIMFLCNTLFKPNITGVRAWEVR